MNRKVMYTALGIAATGVFAVDYLWITRSRGHMKEDYTQMPYKLLLDHTKGCQLLGGKPIKLKMPNLDHVKVDEDTAKLQVRVRGGTRKGIIHTKSIKNKITDCWELEYAVMRVDSGKLFWNVWLYPDEGVESSSDDPLENVETITKQQMLPS